MKPLKIIIFDGSSHPPVFIKRMIDGLAGKGHEIYLLYFGTDKRSYRQNLHYISLGSSKNKFHLIFQSFLLAFKVQNSSTPEIIKLILDGNGKSLQKKNLKLILDEIRPDLIHVQWPALLDILEKVLKEQQIPVILSQRGYQINVKPFVDKTYFQKLANVFPKLSGFHSVSQAISIQGDNIWNSSTKFDEVIYTGLDLEDFTFKENYFRNKKLKLVLVGRPHWKKGLHDVIHASAILQKKTIDFELVIVGGMGNEEILFLTNMYQLENRVKIIGKMPQKDVYDLMSESDLLLVSSIEEGIPNVLVEAMALGIPVISTACGGVEELIEHDKEGWVVPTRDPQALAAQLEKFSLLPNNAIEAIRKAARQKVERQHSNKLMVKRMESLYRKTLGRTEI